MTGEMDRVQRLRWLRNEYVRAIEAGLEPRDLASVGARLERVEAELASLKAPEEGSKVDELRKRREVRLARSETEAAQGS